MCRRGEEDFTKLFSFRWFGDIFMYIYLKLIVKLKGVILVFRDIRD